MGLVIQLLDILETPERRVAIYTMGCEKSTNYSLSSFDFAEPITDLKRSLKRLEACQSHRNLDTAKHKSDFLGVFYLLRDTLFVRKFDGTRERCAK